VTLLERPIRISALVSAARTALRARQRQYQFRQQFEALERSERNLTDFFENAAVGLHLADANGIILRAIQTELDLLGYAAEEYIGHHVSEFHFDADAIAVLLQRLHFGETIEGYEACLRAKDGSSRHVLISANVLWEHGEFIHTRCFTRDITLRIRAAEALREADRRKDEFLATLAHELRNPLAPIRNSLHILRLTGENDPATERVCEMMERQVNHTVRLVDDLMDVSRITRGKIELHKEPVELRSAVETSRPLIEAAGHQLAIAIPPEPLMIEGDLVRLAQVLVNRLNSAAKYTQGDPPTPFVTLPESAQGTLRSNDLTGECVHCGAGAMCFGGAAGRSPCSVQSVIRVIRDSRFWPARFPQACL
jgi:PAS domain S-box-containing protein